MKLDECLAELRTNLLRDASTLKSGPPDHYWSDETLVRYIEDAHRRFARRALCLRDDTTAEVVQVVLSAGVDIYSLHESILRVTSARHEDAQTDLVRITHLLQFSFSNPSVDITDFVTSGDSGQPQRFATDEGVQVDDAHQVRMLFDPAPDATQAGKLVNLRVVRLPLAKLTLDKTDAVPEIPEDWHLDMLEWAAYRALRNWDEDAEGRAKAQQHKDRFEEAVKECLKEVQDRKMYQPVTWKFGFGGYVR